MSADSRAAFFAELDAKLDAGARQYGERSFERPAPELIAELQAEALDIAGWGWILWDRLERLKVAAEAAEAAV